MPAGTPFRTKPQLVREISTKLAAEGSLPVRWVARDESLGYSHAFLNDVADLGPGYLVEVPRNAHVWTTCPKTGGFPSRPVFSALSQEVGAVLRVVARRGLLLGPAAVPPPPTDELKCHLSNAPTTCQRRDWYGWPIEQ